MEVGAPHHRPHFHALYQDALATFALDPIECLAAGSLALSERSIFARSWKAKCLGRFESCRCSNL